MKTTIYWTDSSAYGIGTFTTFHASLEGAEEAAKMHGWDIRVRYASVDSELPVTHVGFELFPEVYDEDYMHFYTLIGNPAPGYTGEVVEVLP